MQKKIIIKILFLENVVVSLHKITEEKGSFSVI